MTNRRSSTKLEQAIAAFRTAALGVAACSLVLMAPAASAQQRTAAPRASGSHLTDGIVAVVGTHPILWSEVLEVIGQERSRGTQLPSDSLGAIAFAKNILNGL